MKKLIIASGLLALMAAATSCDKYDIYPEQYADVLMIKNNGDQEFTVYSVDDEAAFYVNVMKGGWDPEKQVSATLKLMDEAELTQYKADVLGDPNFVGLKLIPRTFFEIYNGKTKIDGEYPALTHNFASEDDRYFGFNVVVDAQKLAKWWESLDMTDRTNFTWVIPVGLYSDGNVNPNGFATMIIPKVTDPVVSVAIDHGAYHIEELSRKTILDLKNKYGADGSAWPDEERYYKYDVKLSIPCVNKNGFTVKLKGNTAVVNDVNSKGKVTLLADKNFKDRVIEYNSDVVFAPGETEANLTVTLDLSRILTAADNVGENRVRGIEVQSIVHPDGTVQDVVDRLQLPMSPDGLDTYKFIVGYRIVEVPLELDDSCVTSNDCEPTEGSINALFDNDLTTFFHSGWTVAFERSAPYGSYLEIEIPGQDLINAVALSITARSQAGASRPPKEIALYYSNTPTDELSWKRFGEKEMSKGITSKLEAGKTRNFGSVDKMIVAPEHFRYLRICILSDSEGQSYFVVGKDNHSWNLAELKLYGKDLDKEQASTPEPEPDPEPDPAE